MREETRPAIRIAPPADEEDQAWLAHLWRTAWGGEIMVSRGRIHSLAEVEALLAWEGETRIGTATYSINAAGYELTSINALAPRRGIGTALLAAVETAARQAGCARVWLITTNDNLDALRFYQRRGYRLVAVYPGSIDAARTLKPTISLTGAFGIPIHDELELEKSL